MKKGLILEGGGMRGIYTAGVLDFFLENDICFDGVIGVSAGACHGCSYLSKQKGRAFAISTDYLNDKRYCSFESLFKTGDLFGKEFVYHDIPEKLNIFDHITYDNNPTKMIAVITNVITGKPEYHILDNLNTKIDTLRASASLPFLSELVKIEDNYYLDGGISDSVPLDYMIEKGYDKIVLVLTQPKDYRKSKNKLSFLASIKYHKYPKLVECIQNRHNLYNRTMDKVDELERLGKIEVIRPLSKIEVGRIEKNVDKLKEAYQVGYDDAKNRLQEMKEFLLI